MKELFKFGGNVSQKTATISGIIGGIILLLIWYLVTASGSISEKILPNPIDVIAFIPQMYNEYKLVPNIAYTVGLNLYGYVLALVVAIPFSFAIGIFPFMRALFQKPIEALRFTPLPSTVGIFVAAVGLTFDMKAYFLAVAILIYLIPSITNTVLDLQNPNNQKDNVYLQTAKTIGMNKWQMFRYVYWPFVMSRVYSEIRNLTAISYTYIVIAETVYRDGGLGASISVFTRQSNMPGVYAGLFIIIIIGVLQDYLLKKLEPVIFKYKRA